MSISVGIFFNALRLDPESAPMSKKVIFIALAFVMFGVVPCLFIYILKKHRSTLDTPETKAKFGSLYLGVRTDATSRVYCVIEFLAVRFLFVFVTFAMQYIPGVLCNVYMLLNNFNIVYLGWYKPYESEVQNRIELANSWMLHMAAYALLLLVHLMPGPEVESNVGWGVIGVIGLIFIVNLGNMLYQTTKTACRDLYLFKLKWDRKRRLKEIERRK